MQPYSDKIPVQNPYYQPPVGGRTWEEWARVYNDANYKEVPKVAGLSSTSGGIAAQLQAIVDSFGGGQYSHDIQVMLMQWLQELNKRDYDAELLRDERAYNQWATKEQREYNESIRDEQRAYDAPTALLHRLMQTGLSRNAAIAMLNGMSGGSSGAIGSASPIVSPSVQPAGAPGGSTSNSSESAEFANYAAGANSIASAFSSLLTAATGLSSFGVSVPAAVSTNTIQQAAAETASASANSQKLSGRYNALLYRASRSGYVKPTEHTFDEVYEPMYAITQEQDPEIYDFMHNGSYDQLIGLPGSYTIASENYNTRFRNKDAFETSRQLALRSDLMRIDLDKVTLDYDWQKLNFEDYNINRDLVNDYTMLKFKYDCEVLRAQNNPKALESMRKRLLDDEQFMACRSALKLRLEQSFVDKSTDPDYQQAMELSYYLDQIGMTGEVGQIVKGVVNLPVIERAGENVLRSMLGLEQNEKSRPLQNSNYTNPYSPSGKPFSILDALHPRADSRGSGARW